MHSLTSILMALSWCLLNVEPAAAQTARQLSLSEAIRLAEANSPLTKQAAARVTAAAARASSAASLPSPVITIGQPFGKNTGGLDEDILITQTIDVGDKRTQRIRSARAEREAAVAERDAGSADLALAVRQAYFEAVRADGERDLAAGAVETSRAFARAAETQFAAGDVPRSNVVRSGIELARAEQSLAAATAERENRSAALKSVTGIPPDTDLALTDGQPATPIHNLAALQAAAGNNRADIRAARRLRDARVGALNAARAQWQPDLFIEGRHSTIDPSVGGSSLRVGVTLPLLDWGRGRADTKAARAALIEQDAILAQAERVAKLEVDTAYRNAEQARRTTASFRSGRLDRAKELLEMAQTGYDRRATTYLELLDAQQVYRSEQLEYLRALAALNLAEAALIHAVGGALP